jgi:hypothetical protein
MQAPAVAMNLSNTKTQNTTTTGRLPTPKTTHGPSAPACSHTQNHTHHAHPNATRTNLNGAHPPKNKKKDPAPVDPAAMYESLKNRIAALEEEEVLEEEEERKFGESV